MWLCGPYLPNSFLTQTSKYKKLTVRFKSNDSVTRLGFKAMVEATGTIRALVGQERSPLSHPLQNTTTGTSLI